MLSMTPRTPEPSEDPVPFITQRFRESGALRRDDVNALSEAAIAAMRGTIQSVVTGLSEDEKPFRVIFGKTSTAATNLKARMVYMGTKAMDDKALTDGRLAAIMVGLAYHEVAHINYDRSYEAFVLEQVKGHPLAHLIHDIHNIGQDIRIEARIARDLPGYADTLGPVLWYMTEQTGAKAPAPKTDKVSPSVARNVFYAAVRAPWIIRDWTGYEDVREWGDDWAKRMSATDKRQTIADLIKEALDMIAAWSKGHVPPPERDATPEEEAEREQHKDDERPDSEDFTEEPEEIVRSKEQDEDEVGSPPPPNDGEGEGTGPGPDDEEPEDEDDDEPEDDEEDDDETEDGEPGEGSDTEDDDDFDPDDHEDDGDEPGEGTGHGDDDEDDEDFDDEDADDDSESRGGAGDEPDEDDDEEWPDIDEPEAEENQPKDGWRDTDGGAMASQLHETPDVSGEVTEDQHETDGESIDIEDLEYPTCAADALWGVNDATYQNVATRVEKSREESATRIIRTPGWADRKVVRRWDWNDTPPQQS